MSELQIVGLGMACLDIILRGTELPTWEKSVQLDALAVEGGGPVATGVVAAARLGAKTGLICTYGCDRLGQIKLQTLTENGIDISRSVQLPEEDQVILVLVHGETGERMFCGFGHTRFKSLTPADLDQQYITSAQYLHLDGCHPEAALQAAQWMHAAGKTVLLDGSSTRGPISPQMRALVENSDILICGSGFGPALTGEQDLWKAGEAILNLGPRIVVQTEGKDGSYTTTREEQFHTPAFDVPVVDTTGAGDVFHGAFLVGLLQGWSLRSVAVFSTAVSAIKCTQLGGRKGIPTFEQTLAFLAERGITPE